MQLYIPGGTFHTVRTRWRATLVPWRFNRMARRGAAEVELGNTDTLVTKYPKVAPKSGASRCRQSGKTPPLRRPIRVGEKTRLSQVFFDRSASLSGATYSPRPT